MPDDRKQKRIFLSKDDLDQREVALCILLNVTENGRKANEALSETLRDSRLAGRDRGLVTAIVEGTLDYLIRIDYILSRYSRKPLRFMAPEARGLLRISAYQILFLDRIPDSAACNEAVEIIKRRGLKGLSGFINAVLRSMIRDKESGSNKITKFPEEHIRYSVPKWLYKKICSDLGRDRAHDIFEAWLSHRDVTVRFNTSLMEEEKIAELLRKEGAEPERLDMEALLGSYGVTLPKEQIPVVYKLGNVNGITSLSAFSQGLIGVQDPASTLPAAMAGIKGGEYIIDVCAAPGGKSLQLCDLLKGSGHVEARDVSEHKLELIRQNAGRMGFSNLSLRCMDALKSDEDSFYRADIVMADLPCSGLGIVGRKPDIKLNIKSYSIEELKELQRDMLLTVSRYVKPRGRLVYSTCTITPEEDELNAAWAASHLGFSIVSTVKLLPDREHDGFFVAVMEKGFA